MKRLVDGVEIELPDDPEATVTPLGDRLVVRTAGGARSAAAVRVGDVVHVSYLGRQFVVEKPSRARAAQKHLSGELHASMPGQIVDVYVSVGDAVGMGQKLLVLEAMKTHQAYSAPFDGVVEQLPVAPGEQVVEGALLVLVVETPG